MILSEWNQTAGDQMIQRHSRSIPPQKKRKKKRIRQNYNEPLNRKHVMCQDDDNMLMKCIQIIKATKSRI